MWIWGSTVICTRQKATGTGGPGGKPGNAGGGENVFAGIEVALIDVTSGKPRLDKLPHVRAAAGAAAMPTPASAMAAEHAVLGADLMVFLPPLCFIPSFSRSSHARVRLRASAVVWREYDKRGTRP
jgi:hypothetical protein